MKRILQFLFMLTVCVSAFSQAANFNMVETSYVTTTISQVVVFDDTMRSGGTLNFTVQAHNGGGNASTGANNDTANLKILYYNAAGTLLYTATTNYSRNLPIPNGYHGVDPTVPWTTLSLSSANCGGSCSTVAYAKVQMVGIDGAYWAGDYGPYYQQPVLTFNGGGNILYNPEFGVGNGTLVQGWTASPNWGVCQGAYGGSNPCTTNYAGVTANMNNGGYSATGGTTSAAPGGYGTPPVTVTSTSVSYTSRSVVTSPGVTSTYRTPVTTTNYSDGTSTTSTGNETLYSTTVVGYTERTVTYGATTYTYRTDTTTTTYASNNTSTTTTGTEYLYSTYVDPNYTYPSYVTVGSGTPGEMTFGSANPLTSDQQTKVDTWANKTLPDGNVIYIQQVSGDQNTVTMDQTGNKNLIRLQLNGTNNNITARQGVADIGQNEMKLTFEGNNNTVNLNQARDTQGNPLGINGHYLDATIAGWGNVLTVQQTNAGGVGGHYNETTINGNGNSVVANQLDNGNKIMFLKVDGALNSIDATQRGNAQHKLDVTLTGDRNSVTALQEGNTANNATLNLTNAGGPASVILQQNGGQSVSVTTSCATAGGCAPITVRQGY